MSAFDPKQTIFAGMKLRGLGTMAENVSRPIRLLILFTMVVVALSIGWQTYRDSQTYTLTPKQVLINELKALPAPSGAQSLGDAKLIDRMSFYTVEQRYTSSISRDTVARGYTEILLADGWRPAWESHDEHHSLWFCKNGVLASIDFAGATNSPTYKVTLITGGWVIRVCG